MRKILVLLILLLLIPAVHASGLAFKDMSVEIDGESDDNVNAAGGSFEAAPGDNIELAVEVENDYPSTTEEHKIKHIDVSIDIDTFCSQDLDESIEEEIRINDLNPDTDDEATFRFKIPDCANEDNYDIDIKVDGKDEDGTEYSIEETVAITIDKETSSMIMGFSLDSALTCDNNQFSATVEAHNLGAIDEDAGLLIISDELGINKFEFMDLRTGKWTDEDTQFLKSYTFTVDDVEAGDYDLRAEVEYAGNSKEIKRWLTITVPECEVAEETLPESVEEAQPEEPDEIAQTYTIPEQTEPQTTEKEFLSMPVLIGALVVGMIVLIVMIVMLKRQQ